MADTGWSLRSKYGRIVVEGPEETYVLSNERSAKNIAEGRALGRLTVESAKKLESLDHFRYGAPKPARKTAAA